MKKKEYEMMQQDNVACRKKKSLLPSPVFQYFEQIALDDPKKCAVINKQSSITYGDLLNDVLQLSHALQKIGVTTGNTVISTLTPSLNLIKLQLALHHLRATYLPIDPCFPKKRIEFIVKEVTPILLFAESKNLDKFLGITPSITVDQILKNERRTPLKLEKRKPDNKVAYISYTSGSTGTPKGVQVTYNNFLSLLHSVKEELPFTRSSTMLFFSKPWFDITNVEIFLPLLNGASIAIPPKESFLNGKSLSKFLNSTKTTVMQTTPSIWHILIDSGLEKHPQITSISTGEELTQELNQSLHSHFKRVWNFYGPTECTIYATASCTAPGSKPSIGTPLQNTQILILTPEGKETKKGEAGEIYIGGQGVSAGYLKRPKETKEKFTTLETFKMKGHFYKTGDVGKILPNGQISFLGRKDSEVKFRGYRIDLREIEHTIRKVSTVNNVLVRPLKKQKNRQKLCAYIILKNDSLCINKKKHEEIEVNRWQEIYNSVYKTEETSLGETFNTTGWRDSYEGKAFNPLEVENATNNIVDRILSYKPKRILEVGCGTGLLLFKLAPFCKEYTGTDIAKAGLDFIQQKAKEKGLSNIYLLNQEARCITGLKKSYDVIVINSVIHHFPSESYLSDVMLALEPLLSEEGVIIAGDIRNRQLIRHYYCSIAMQRAETHTPYQEILKQINDSIHKEKQLLLPPSFFKKYFQERDVFQHIEISPKISEDTNEITKFRYDVALSKKAFSYHSLTLHQWMEKTWTLTAIDSKLKAGESFLIKGFPNAKLRHENTFLSKLNGRKNMKNFFDPHEFSSCSKINYIDLYSLEKKAVHYGYIFEASCLNSDEKGTCDISFIKNNSLPKKVNFLGIDSRSDKPEKSFGEEKAQDLAKIEIYDECKKFLPEYMIPSNFIFLNSFPLNSSGKVETKKLPEPHYHSRILKDEYVEPQNQIEENLVSVWKTVLNLDKIGIEDNFFRLGGDSILCMLMIRKAKEYGLFIDFQTVFSKPTIHAIAQNIQHEKNSPLERESVEIKDASTVPLTPSQQLMCYPMRSNKNVYCQHALLQATDHDKLPEAIQKAAQALIEKYDALHSTVLKNTQRRLELSFSHPIKSRLIYRETHLPHNNDIDRKETLEKHAQSIFNSLDLEEGKLIALNYIKIGTEIRILFAVHSLVADSISFKILLEEFKKNTIRLLLQKKTNTTKSNFSFKKWGLYLQQHKQSIVNEEELDYWKKVEEKKIIPLLSRQKSSTVLGFKRDFNPKYTTMLLNKIQKNSLETRSALMTAFAYTLRNEFGDETVEIESHGRYDTIFSDQLADAIGQFSTYFPFNVELTKGVNFWKNAKTLEKKIQQIPFRGAHYQLLKLSSFLTLQNTRPRVAFNYLGKWDSSGDKTMEECSLFISSAPERIKNTQYDQYENLVGLSVNILNINDAFSFAFKYDPSVFSEPLILKFSDELFSALEKTAEGNPLLIQEKKIA